MRKLAANLVAVLNRPRLVHYLEIFLAGAGTALYYQRDHLLGAHGLNAVGCLVFGACVAGGKAALETYRKSTGVAAAPPADPSAPPAS